MLSTSAAPAVSSDQQPPPPAMLQFGPSFTQLLGWGVPAPQRQEARALSSLAPSGCSFCVPAAGEGSPAGSHINYRHLMGHNLRMVFTF